MPTSPAAAEPSGLGRAAQPETRFLEDLYEPSYGGRQFSLRDTSGIELVVFLSP